MALVRRWFHSSVCPTVYHDGHVRVDALAGIGL